MGRVRPEGPLSPLSEEEDKRGEKPGKRHGRQREWGGPANLSWPWPQFPRYVKRQWQTVLETFPGLITGALA